VPKVVIGASDAALLAGIRLALAAGGLLVAGEARSVAELLAIVHSLEPHACLVDAELEGGGLRAAAELGVSAPDVRVVLLASSEGEQEFLEAMRVGAAGYVPASIAPDRLPSVVHAVLKGEPAIPRALVASLINQYRERPGRRRVNGGKGRSVDLTSREWEVLELMRDGLSTRDIAASLFISEVTVRRHIGSVLKKLRVATRADALKLLQSA